MRAAASFAIVLCTCPEDAAAMLARSLVDAKLAACVNLLPAGRSIYRWQGKVTQDTETLLVIKTTQVALERLERHLTKIHPYEVPELLVVDIAQGNAEYLDWLAGHVV